MASGSGRDDDDDGGGWHTVVKEKGVLRGRHQVKDLKCQEMKEIKLGEQEVLKS